MLTPKWKPLYDYYMGLPMHPDGEFFSCAVRLSMCLDHSLAFDKASFRKRGHKTSKHGWAMVAEELYQWLRLHALGPASQVPITASDWSQLPKQNGIVYLRDCFFRTTDRASRTGDHIDLYVAGQGMLSAIRWPVEFPEGPTALMGSCQDGRIRFWPAS